MDGVAGHPDQQTNSERRCRGMTRKQRDTICECIGFLGCLSMVLNDDNATVESFITVYIERLYRMLDEDKGEEEGC